MESEDELDESENMGKNGNFGLTGGMYSRETMGTNFNLNHRKNNLLSSHQIYCWKNMRGGQKPLSENIY